MIERGMLTQRQHRILEIDADDGRRLLRELLARRLRRDGRSEDETFEWTKTYAVSETDEVEVAEDVGVAAIEGISEAVCEEGVACESLGLLDEEAEGERGRRVEGGRRAGREQPCLRVDDETSDEVQVGLCPVLLGQLLEPRADAYAQCPTLSTLSASIVSTVSDSEHSPSVSPPDFCRNCPR